MPFMGYRGRKKSNLKKADKNGTGEKKQRPEKKQNGKTYTKVTTDDECEKVGKISLEMLLT